uniref:Uncharacterized protein n=1 Tax=Ditylenchus dipsaci TaxID=166011 RepID=A0A915EMU8_9BILA
MKYTELEYSLEIGYEQQSEWTELIIARRNLEKDTLQYRIFFALNEEKPKNNQKSELLEGELMKRRVEEVKKIMAEHRNPIELETGYKHKIENSFFYKIGLDVKEEIHRDDSKEIGKNQIRAVRDLLKVMQIDCPEFVQVHSKNPDAIVQHEFRKVVEKPNNRGGLIPVTISTSMKEKVNFIQMDLNKENELDCENARETAVVMNKILAILSNEFVPLYETIQEKANPTIKTGKRGKQKTKKFNTVECYAHGFVHGVLEMHFKYEFNIDLMPEKMCGRGYADLVVLIMGRRESKSKKAVPSIVEFKTTDNGGPFARGKNMGKRRIELGYEQIIAKGYAYTRPNIRTASDDVVMIGDEIGKDQALELKNLLLAAFNHLDKNVINGEEAFHAVLHGLLTTQNNYVVFSEATAGTGRMDLFLKRQNEFKDNKETAPVIIELKQNQRKVTRKKQERICRDAFLQVCTYVPVIKHSTSTEKTHVVVIAHFSEVDDFQDSIMVRAGDRITVHSSNGVGAHDDEKYGFDREEIEEQEKEEIEDDESDQVSDYDSSVDDERERNEPCTSLKLLPRRNKREINLTV